MTSSGFTCPSATNEHPRISGNRSCSPRPAVPKKRERGTSYPNQVSEGIEASNPSHVLYNAWNS
eukprot:scaffold764_cov363-Pavlova_lutheri.AAC.21